MFLAELESIVGAEALLEEALREAPKGTTLEAVIHCRLAWVARFNTGFDHPHAALEVAEELDDDVLRTQARTVKAVLGWFAGDPEAQHALPELALDLPAALGGEQRVQEATLAVVNTLAPLSTRDRARVALEREHRQWRDRNEPRSAHALWGLAWVEFWAGRWELAAAHAVQAHDISIQYGLEVPQDHLPIALVAVHRGQFELAREHSERALGLADEQFALRPPQHMAILGLVAYWSGDGPGALDWFDQADRRAAELGWREPSVRWWASDYSGLLLELGRVDDAVEVIDVWEEDARRVGREWVLAHVTRCRGLVAAAQGEIGQAEPLLRQAVAEHEAVGDPFGRARALLDLGVVRRRARQKRAAQEAIEAALGGFEELGQLAGSRRRRPSSGESADADAKRG